MSAVQVSRLVRLALEARWENAFNERLAVACAEFGIFPLAYTINFEQLVDQPQNFYRGNRTLDALVQLQEPDLPALAMWADTGGNLPPGQREMPRKFSGVVFAGWRFFLMVQGLRSAGLVDLREATEAAMVDTLDPEFSGINYRGDLNWQAPPEQVWLDQDDRHVGFVQVIEFQASFGVNV